MAPEFRIGLPRMHKEAGERRDFLPGFVAYLTRLGASVILEEGYGSGMGLRAAHCCRAATSVRFGSLAEVYAQDYVLVLRFPSEAELEMMRPGACLISMVHYPTGPERVKRLRQRGLEAISLDAIKDDTGRRLVENMRAVAWNGLEVAFQTLRRIYPAPGFDSPRRPPIRVTVLGAGAVGTQAVAAAVRYGNEALRRQLAVAGVPGVQVTTVDYDLSGREDVMRPLLAVTDILVDATQRPDTSRIIIPNDWIGYLPEHAVLLDLSADPYDCVDGRCQVKGIEGMPHGNLDQYVFAPDDPVYETLPGCVITRHRRHAVSCYSWPGIHPRECMKVYGHQLAAVMRTLIGSGGVEHINPDGSPMERAISRARLSAWSAAT